MPRGVLSSNSNRGARGAGRGRSFCDHQVFLRSVPPFTHTTTRGFCGCGSCYEPELIIIIIIIINVY